MMAPLPAALDPRAPLRAWRVDTQQHSLTWDSGAGAEKLGGRWNPIGVAVVYCSIDPSTALIEVAVHKGFEVLDTQPHVLTCLQLIDTGDVKVVTPADVPNPAWLHSGTPSRGQQAHGASLLGAHAFVLFPSAVSKSSWNLVFNPARAAGKYRLVGQERLVVDTRLNP